MPLVNTKEMLLSAKKNSYAVGAFNVENMEMAQAVIEAAEQCKAPVILQTTPSTVRYADTYTYFAMISAIAKNATVPIALHLDHGNSLELCTAAYEAGYTSIMIDGSKLPIDENIALTKSVTVLCSKRGIPVEGELGQVGGKEDDTECDNAGYTNPSEAQRFEKETGVSSLAVGVGTAHGVYATVPKLNTALISELRVLLSIPMVLHGASGLSDEAVRECIERGICKVNFATELRIAYSEGVKETIKANPAVFDPKAYGKAGREKVKALVCTRMAVCGCVGKG